MRRPPPRSALVMVTGASRGFGRALALEANRSVRFWDHVDGSRCRTRVSLRPEFDVQIHNILWSRDESALDDVARTIRHWRSLSMASSSSLGFAVATGRDCPALRADFRSAHFQDKVQQVTKFLQRRNRLQGAKHVFDYNVALLVNNAGTLGDPRPVSAIDDVRGWSNTMRDVMHVNAIAPALLAREFCERFGRSPGCQRTVVVYITSLASITAFESWSQYCASKAGGEMAHRVLALEYPNVEFVAYAPGPMDTDMQRIIRNDMLPESTTRQHLAHLQKSGGLVDPHESARKLLQLLKQSQTKGTCSHVDYYDIESFQEELEE
mmetsp:Transcript_18421/g.38567  ORF Transcript_18421/g.38567 Transcript_18421/m.38567 type:complete len:323 (+) Transcript_18421:3286-4254(+)